VKDYEKIIHGHQIDIKTHLKEKDHLNHSLEMAHNHVRNMYHPYGHPQHPYNMHHGHNPIANAMGGLMNLPGINKNNGKK